MISPVISICRESRGSPNAMLEGAVMLAGSPMRRVEFPKRSLDRQKNSAP